MRRLLFLMLLLTFSAATPATLYKWVDKDGNVTYSQLKPPDAKAEEVKVHGSAVSNEQARERLDQLNEKTDAAAKDREFKQTHASESAERDARLKENCKIAQDNLRVLQTASRVKDAEGNYVDEKARAARIAQTKQEIENSCG